VERGIPPKSILAWHKTYPVWGAKSYPSSPRERLTRCILVHRVFFSNYNSACEGPAAIGVLKI